jgi:3(or 17)beta-hydroxysteroid dehydrogenase
VIRPPDLSFENIMQRLNEKTCVVTGAARGIGRAIANRFHAEGAFVVITDINEEEGVAAAAGIGCRFEKLDVREEVDWVRLASIVPVADVVVNNAGVTGFEGSTVAHDPEHASLADWREVHRVNLDGTFLGCRYAIGAMKAQGTGSIINISSRSGLVGIPLAAAYASSKAAIRNHSKSVALYCAQQGWQIRCNSIRCWVPDPTGKQRCGRWSPTRRSSVLVCPTKWRLSP